MTNDDIIELISQLRSMSRCEHEDMTVASDAADAMHEMMYRIAILEKVLEPLADMWLYPDDEANMNDRKHPEFQSSAPETLEKLVMDPKVPKSEAQWWACREITRYRAGLQKIVQADGFWDAPSLARDLLDGKPVT